MTDQQLDVKIAYLLDTYPSATETFIAREIEALRQRGFEISIWALNAGEGAQTIPEPLTLKLSKHRFQRVGELLSRQEHAFFTQIDHIHAAWASIPAEITHALAQATKKPWSFFAHARDLWVEGGDLSAKLASARWAASCTQAGTTYLRQFAPQTKRVFYAPHGLSLELYPWQQWQVPPKPKLLGVGRLVEKKGWQDAIIAANQLNLPLEIIGDGPLKRSLETQGALLLGTLPPDEVRAAMQKASCLLLPSRRTAQGDRDGLANVLLEAAALGLPIVTTEAGSARDLLDENSAIFVASADPPALAAGIESTFADSDATQARCRAARARVEANFDIDENIDLLANLFRESLAA